jgi:hypothetical protein
MHVCELDVCSYPINPWCTMYLPWNLVCVCVLTLETLTHVCELQPMLYVCVNQNQNQISYPVKPKAY